MGSMQENLDGFRVLSDLLARLRDDVFSSLKEIYGEAWYEEDKFAAIIKKLIARKEAEASIDWHNDEYQELIRFTDFTDILGFIEEDPNLVPRLSSLASGQELLHTRFLELETLRRKLSLGRSITESELAYVTAFYRRYQKRSETASAGPRPEPAPKPKDPPDDEPTPPADPPEFEAPPTPPTPPEPVAEPEPAVSAAVDDERTPQDDVRASQKLTVALDEGDDKAVLRHLYNEVTALSDHLFDPDEPTYPTVWPVVRRSDWYESSFTDLGLRPLSNFYELLDQATEYKNTEGGEADMHAFLKEHDFARVLLELRDMFQKTGV